MTKPMGAIPPEFVSEGGSLLIGGERVDALVAQAGDARLFVYDRGRVEARC